MMETLSDSTNLYWLQVTAALVDSAVDLVSQGVLSLAESYMMRHSPDYPVGRSRLEALSVMVCAFIMSFASLEVIQFSLADIVSGLNGTLPQLEVGITLYAILCVGTALKLALFIYCRYVNLTLKSDMLDALAEDHFNDVLSNSAAMITAAIAYNTSVRFFWTTFKWIYCCDSHRVTLSSQIIHFLVLFISFTNSFIVILGLVGWSLRCDINISCNYHTLG